ncbi:TetM/TetW/TetO/TetS family tetracycline resistance ribosomal protection protein [Saccharibacillus sp. CPCC 101409]|uniref:elongation factor G n=1 Tax=Saccharibacillus sp. CPCC 101409 TaxID=3058041 RepID=UPI00267184FA|nr:TetM/TetW/TetO/TetS family tetracycline resistance ribosomal protection protein [Saccharibacillus sp. CPCC 101409]MDO3413045.1 TetM/TetW/TetO/TetS family tetracycline resistance ribosomal protection protein [Saccharibacillus sp. CPCC 101409]
MNKTIGMLAHVDAGKTTFAEQLLYHTNSIRSRGRVDHKDAFMDSHEIERARGITVFAGQAVMRYRDSTYYLLDTPGHADFSAEMERALRTMDYAVVLLSAVEGVEGHTETVWQLLRRYRIPAFFFINKTDRAGADAERVLGEIRGLLTGNAVELTDTVEVGEGNGVEPVRMADSLKDFLAERDEALLEDHLEDRLTPERWTDALIAAIRDCRIYPCLHGSALLDVGVTDFLAKFDRLTATDYAPAEEAAAEPFAGRVYKIGHDEAGTRLTYIKALRGSLGVREFVRYAAADGANAGGSSGAIEPPPASEAASPDRAAAGSVRPPGSGAATPDADASAEPQSPLRVLEEKVTGIRVYSGDRYTRADRVYAGELFAVTGLTEAQAGGGLGELLHERVPFEMAPTLTAGVDFPQDRPVRDVLRVFRMLEAEDPALGVLWEEELQELQIRVMGAIQLEVLHSVLQGRFGLDVVFGEPEILYRETVSAPVTGYGHFEPLKHYAEVHLRIEPGERGSGVVFADACHPDDLALGYRNLIGQHVGEREHHGLLTGSPLTDVRVTLLTGRAHNKHTHGGDFREAAFRALRQGLEQADNVLLEPCYRFRIRAELAHMGRIMADVQQAYGIFDPPETGETHLLLTGIVPAATFMNYATELASFTRGKGMLGLSYGGYRPCHNAEEVIARRGYDKNADPLYTSSSIFCAKGAGYSMPWDEAEAAMHLL